YNSLDEKTKANIDAALGAGQFALDVGTLGIGKKAGEIAIEQGLKSGTKAIETGTKVAEDIIDSTGKITKNITKFGGKTDINKAIESITPNVKQLSPSEKQILLDEQKLIPETKLSPAKVLLNAEDEAMALKYKDLLQNNKSIENSYNLSNRIIETSKGIEQYLIDTKLVYPQSKLKTQILNSVKSISKPISISDSSWNKATTQLVDDFLNSIPKGKTIKGMPQLVDLYNARKKFDINIENALNAFEGTPTAKKQLAKSIRNTTQQFITDQLGENTYKQAMKDIWEMYNLKEIVDNKAIKEMGYTEIQNWMKSNPVQAKIIRTTGGILKLGTAFGIVQ
ncbi:MAG: hypothetical protein M1308_11565, partial [Actinobacteria bacterium]|nr:hypothetical protein [Actinomycetota bacterium]